MFCEKGVPKICAKKEIIDIDMLTTSKNGDRKVMQPIRITSEPATKLKKWNHFSQFR